MNMKNYPQAKYRFWFFFIVSTFIAVSYLLPATAENQKLTDSAHVIIKPNATATLSSQIPGVINSIVVKPGDTFKKGSRLITFDCTIYKAQLKKAQAGLEAKRSEHSANQKLAKLDAISQYEIKKTDSDLKALQAEVAIKQHQVDMCVVKAPFDGQVVKLAVHAHENINQGQELIKIINNQDLRAEILVPSDWLKGIKVGTNVTLSISETGKKYSAVVTKIVPHVDSVSQAVMIYAKVSGEAPGLISGMSGDAKFAGQ